MWLSIPYEAEARCGPSRLRSGSIPPTPAGFGAHIFLKESLTLDSSILYSADRVRKLTPILYTLKERTEYKKSSAILVFNDDGKLALQLRAGNDDSFPLHWDFSAGGGIESGEDGKLSAEREPQEELGIKADVEFISQEHHKYPAWKPSITREVDLLIYKANHNGPFSPDPKEVEKVQFFTLEDIQKMINSGDKFHPEFILSWKKGIITKAAVK